MGQSGIEVRKYWDATGGRMVIILRNNGQSVSQATVEDAYPADISGLLCFAKPGGIVPAATASAGKITWRVAGLKPGEVRELVYTSLSQETLRDPSSKKRPTDRDAALLSAMGGFPPRLIFEDTATDPIVKIPPPEIPAPLPEQPVTGVDPVREPTAAGKAAVVISVGAGKGGTGKTTFSINLGIALAEMGFDTVLLDADTSMSNMASYMGIDVQCMKATLHEVLSGKAEPDKAVYRAFNNRLRIVPSGLSIAGFLAMDRNLLGDIIGHFSKDADFIVIDTPAGYNKEVALSLYASDYLLLVLNPDEGSMIDGLKVQEMARILDVRVPGIVLNRYDMTGHQYSRSQIEQYFGTPVIAMVPEDGEMRRKDKVPAILANPCSRTSGEIYHVAETISGRKRDMQPTARPFATRLMEALFKQ